MNKEIIILGVDPGTTVMGYGVLLLQGNKTTSLALDVIRLEKIASHELKIKKIFETMIEIIEKYNPDFLAIEAPFFGKNVQSMLKLGRAQGVAIAAALSRNIPYKEYSPRKIKQSITGNGNASKEQVALMLQRLLGLKEIPAFLDATDALAVALCHSLQKELPKSAETKSTTIKLPKGKASSWSSFVTSNPDRILKANDK